MKLAQKGLLGSPLSLALNSVHGVAFHRGLGEPLYASSSIPMLKYLDAEDIAQFGSAAYTRDNIAVVANGASHSEFSKWVGDFFQDTRSGPKLSSPASQYYGGEERIAHGSGSVLVIGFAGSSSFTSGSSYKPEISVLASLLGGETSIKWSPGFSLLSKAAKDFPHVQVSTQHAAYSDAGLLYVTFTGDAAQIAKASKAAVETIKKIASGEIAEEDIKKATALAKFRALEAGQQTEAGLEATGSGLISGGKAFQIDEIGAAIDKVSADKVKSVSLIVVLIFHSSVTNSGKGGESSPRVKGFGFGSGRSFQTSIRVRDWSDSLKRRMRKGSTVQGGVKFVNKKHGPIKRLTRCTLFSSIRYHIERISVIHLAPEYLPFLDHLSAIIKNLMLTRDMDFARDRECSFRVWSTLCST